MKKSSLLIFSALLLLGLFSCLSKENIVESDFIGNFQEKEYDFFESFQHSTDVNYYFNLPFHLKFGGIRPFPFDTVGEQDYSWLRNPKNLMLAFQSAKSIGFDRFVSSEQYMQPHNSWCCDTQWENKSLNQIVKEFINSDTTAAGNNYYSKFWSRRKKEGNLREAFYIFKQIDQHYAGVNKQSEKADNVLKNLLEFDLKLNHSDSLEYRETSIEYFDYLKSVKLDYSAYKLLMHNEKLNLQKEINDSLIRTLKHDTLSKEMWVKLNDNKTGWITWKNYHDPLRYYGP